MQNGSSLQSTYNIPPFECITQTAFTRSHITSLAAGRIAAIRVPDFIDPGYCRESVKRLANMDMGVYKEELVDPPILKFGPAINEYNNGGYLAEEYWGRAKLATMGWQQAMNDIDIRARAISMLSQAWGDHIEIASVHGRQLFAGMIREINNGTHVHFDSVAHEYPHGLHDNEPIAQMALNVYLAVPPAGGETTVWQQRWRPDDEAYRFGYGYTDRVVRSSPSVVFRASVGEAVLFDSRLLHAVAASHGDRRVTLSFCIGIASNGAMTVWS